MKNNLRKKVILIVLCVICVIAPTIIYGIGLMKNIQFNAKCINYFELASNANSVDIAEKHLSSGIKYLEDHGLTEGDTSCLMYKPTNDISFWYENLKSTQTQLREVVNKETLTELEESNLLMKLRETLLDEDGDVIYPIMIEFYPNHNIWRWLIYLIWVLYLAAIKFVERLLDL